MVTDPRWVPAPVNTDRPSSKASRWRTPYRWASGLERGWPWHIRLAEPWTSAVYRFLMTLGFRSADLRPEALARWGVASHARTAAM